MKRLAFALLIFVSCSQKGSVTKDIDLDAEVLKARTAVHYLFLTKVTDSLYQECRPDLSIIPSITVTDLEEDRRGEYMGGYKKEIRISPIVLESGNQKTLERVLFHEYIHHAIRRFDLKCSREFATQMATYLEKGSELND